MNGFQYKYGDRPLEGYTIQRAVGRGGFGEVYFALSDSGREVALKVIQGYEQIELRGVSQCMNLKSPHLVTIFDVRHNNEGKPFVIMEYVAGPSLKDLLEQSPSGIGPQKAAFFLREIAKGLTYLHDRGIVHRDLKPGNIFYEDGYVKIGDYGLSKAMSASRYSGQTITVGTVHYMAPEIGQGRYDSGVDIYALGCCLYEMLTGNVPYFGASHGEILMKHLMAEPDLTGIEEPFAAVIRKALAKEPADRFKSAQEMVEAVFGAEHIRDSVSCFSPDSLTMVAGRIAQKVAVGGPGSSADAVRLGSDEYPGATPGHPGVTPGYPGASPVLPPLPRGGFGGVPGAPVPPAAANDPWQNLAQRMDRLGERMGQAGERIGEQMRQVGDRITGHAPRPEPQAPQPAAGEILDSGIIAFADPKHDPLNGRQRNMLALVTATVAAVLTTILTGNAFEARGPDFLLPFSLILSASLGINLARRRIGNRLHHEPGTFPRLVYGGTACIASLPALIFLGAIQHIRPHAMTGTLAAFAVSLLLVNWRQRTAPGRQERVGLGHAFSAALLGWILGICFGGAALLVAGMLAGVSMAAQVNSPFDPQAVRQPKRKNKAQWLGANPANEIPNAPAPAAPNPTPALNENRPANTTVVPCPPWMPHPHPQPDARQLYMIPSWLRAISLFFFVASAGTGLMLLFWAGLTPHSSYAHEMEMLMAISFGCGCLGLSLFSLVWALKRTYRSIWSSFARPFLMLLCAQSILTSSVVIGNDTTLHDEDLLLGLAFIIFPGILFLLLFFIGDRAVQTLFLGVEGAAASRTQQNLGPSDRKWPIALGLACLGLIPMPFPFVSGIHRFYVGRIGTGILWLLTGGLLGIGTIVDIILIATGRFRDSTGRLLLKDGSTPSAPLPPVPAPPAGPYPQPANVGPTNQPTPFAPNPEPLSGTPPIPSPYVALWAGPTEPPPPHSYHRASRKERISRLLTFLGGLLLITAAACVLAGVILPWAIAAGFPDGPRSAADMTHAFGTPNWPALMAQLGAMLGWAIGLLGLAALIVARRHAGPAHIVRAVLAAGVIGWSLSFLSDVVRYANYEWVAGRANGLQGIGPLVGAIADSNTTTKLVVAGLGMIVAVVLVSWPANRREAGSTLNPTGGGPTL